MDKALNAMQAELAKIIGQWTVEEENYATPIDGLFFFRREAMTEPCFCTIEPSVVFVVQGTKQLLLNEQAFVYDKEHFLLNSFDLPASSQVLCASSEHPCLGLMLRLDLPLMVDIITQHERSLTSKYPVSGSAAIGSMTFSLLEPFARLLALLNEPDAIEILSPLIVREIHYRLLTSDLAGRLWQLASIGSQSHRVWKVVNWLRRNYTKPVCVEELAVYAQMSTTTLHHHFREHVTMSPLQYQKWLRLNEAKRLMLNDNFDVSSAAFQVGYESPSQFSREYSRLFGIPPKRHIDALRKGTSVE